MRKGKNKKLTVHQYLGEDSWGNTPSDLRNVGSIPMNSWMMIHELDQKLTGTPDYMGMTYFWGYEYRHYLRDASPSQRRRVHKQFLDQGLDVAGESQEHLRIIRSVLKVSW